MFDKIFLASIKKAGGKTKYGGINPTTSVNAALLDKNREFFKNFIFSEKCRQICRMSPVGASDDKSHLSRGNEFSSRSL